MKIIELNLSFNGTLSKRSKTDFIVLHHAEAQNASAEQVHGWHLNNGWSGIGYHFYVRKNGDIFRGRPVDTVGAHAQGFNSQSVGVCFEGAYNDKDTSMPQAQLQAGAELVRELRNVYKTAKVVKHGDLMATACPGKNFPFDKIASGEVEEVPKFHDTHEHWAEKYVDEACEMGIMNGSGDGFFRPDAPITRAEAAVVARNIVRYITGK